MDRDGLSQYIAELGEALDRGNRDVRALLPALEQARYQLCAQDRELRRLRELEVKWVRALDERGHVGTLMLAANAATQFLDATPFGRAYADALRESIATLQDLGPMERPVTEADIERFRKQVPSR